MTLYFAYGSNMSRAAMARRCPTAHALGVATLAGWRFRITTDGFASIARAAGGKVIGVLWQLSPRDLAALNAYESLDSGLYVRRQIMVRHGSAARSAMVYIARATGDGRPQPRYIGGRYMESIIAAAREWRMPAAYIGALQRWSPSTLRAMRATGINEIA